MKKYFLVLFILSISLITFSTPKYDLKDTNMNGFPDEVELNYQDTQNFRNWFKNIILNVLLNEESELPKNYADCAGLARFAYKEALKKHTQEWIDFNKYIGPVFEDINKYNYPDVPILDTNIFRLKKGVFSQKKIKSDFAAYCSARFLVEYNTTYVSKKIESAKSGDILAYFHAEDPNYPYHIMIFINHERKNYVVYHTGPLSSTNPGEIRIVELKDIEQADPTWLPIQENKHFMGIYRFKILGD